MEKFISFLFFEGTNANTLEVTLIKETIIRLKFNLIQEIHDNQKKFIYINLQVQIKKG